jgi:hypothetical protein
MLTAIPLDEIPNGVLYDDVSAAGRIEGKTILIEERGECRSIGGYVCKSGRSRGLDR